MCLRNNVSKSFAFGSVSVSVLHCDMQDQPASVGLRLPSIERQPALVARAPAAHHLRPFSVENRQRNLAFLDDSPALYWPSLSAYPGAY